MRQSAAIKKVVAVWTLICMMLPSFVFTVSAEKENISLANVVTEDSKLVFDGFKILMLPVWILLWIMIAGI